MVCTYKVELVCTTLQIKWHSMNLQVVKESNEENWICINSKECKHMRKK